VRFLKSKHPDPRPAGCQPGQVHCFQRSRGRGTQSRSVHTHQLHSGHILTNRDSGIKEYSEWPTIPQLYVDKEFVGGTDILMSMHQDGSLAKLLEEKDVLVPAE
jgi:glutaredoxin